MAQKAIREFHAKNLISNNIPELKWKYKGILITSENLNDIDKLNFKKYVAKPDQLFGKRGKNGLIFISDDRNEVKKWIASKIDKKVKVVKNSKDKGIEGILTHFIVEPAVEHDKEYYLAIKTEKDYDVIYFSEMGGIDIEENWESVNEIKIPFTLEPTSKEVILNLFQDLVTSQKSDITQYIRNDSLIEFITNIYNFFKKLNFTYLELNPFVIVDSGFLPLDTVARLDSTAAYEMDGLWDNIDFPKPFGAESSEIEAAIENLDEKTSASLKLTILNPNGRIWLLTAGGGASVIYADTVADLGFVEDLGNYGEYSGNPSQDETEAYCNNLFKAMFASKTKNKILIIGGGIANFTDVAATFKGIINAIKNNSSKFLKQKIKIYVRRGGPNYKQGLELIKQEVEKLHIPIEIYGPEIHMTRVVSIALE